MTTQSEHIIFIPHNVAELQYMYSITCIWLEDTMEEICCMNSDPITGEWIPLPFSTIQ